jgi:hypothetical protein
MQLLVNNPQIKKDKIWDIITERGSLPLFQPGFWDSFYVLSTNNYLVSVTWGLHREAEFPFVGWVLCV